MDELFVVESAVRLPENPNDERPVEVSLLMSGFIVVVVVVVVVIFV